MPTARGIRRWKGLDFKSVVKRLVGDSTLWFRFTPILREHRWSGVPSRFPFSRMPLCHPGTLNLPIIELSLGFEPRPHGTAVRWSFNFSIFDKWKIIRD
ncbi:hypothetical protein TNCV_5098121 [Trichonephila clavipes]|uniref:Uncharacterized protein n=1 Tax=Trichonephila clavipes TaxID=2585209 RepID=A0A8X6RXF5_TRICX|nr:hypothetical protein TNCV_5098121 [Trichonephila clavipes]